MAIPAPKPPFVDTNTRWTALVARDPAADGAFVYCVKTTKIYCRPICKARLARRANIEFLQSPHEAERAGYRACKRCRPELSTFTPEADTIRRVCNVIRESPTEKPLPQLDALAKEAGLTKSHFHRTFKKVTGVTPREFALDCRASSSSRSDYSTPTNTSGVSTESETTSSEYLDMWMDTEDIPGADFSLITSNDMEYAATGFSQQTPVPLIISGDYEPGSAGLMDANKEENICTIDREQQIMNSTSNDFLVLYTIRKTLYGLLLVALINEEICKLDLGETESELMTNLEFRYPAWLYTWKLMDDAGSCSEAMQQRVVAVVEALERPTGKIIDLNLEESVLEGLRSG